jgi:hypothetical protein
VKDNRLWTCDRVEGIGLDAVGAREPCAFVVEIDETYIGDKIKDMPARKRLSLNQGRSAPKVTVMRMLDRKSRATLS